MPVEARLSNGQLFSWREIERYPRDWLAEANLPSTWDLRGTSMEQVMRALRRVVDRHEALRTTYHVAGGTPVQRVHETVEPPVLHDDRVVTDPSEHERTKAEQLAIPFAMEDDLNWRARLVSTDGVPLYMTLTFSHLIVDVWSIHHIQDQFKALLADPGATAVTGPAPREVGRRQREESWRPRQESSERYWRGVLEQGLTDALPTLPARVKRDRLELTLHSRALGGYAAEAGRMHGVTAPAVLMAFVAAGLARHLGTDRVTLSLMSSNRFAPEDQHNVGTMNQLIPFVAGVDLRATLAEHVRRLHWASARAYRHSCYDIDRIAAMAAGLGERPGHDCWVNHLFRAWFNYIQVDRAPSDPRDPAPAELAWTPLAQQYGQAFRVRVEVRGGRTSVLMLADPEVLPAEAMTDVMRTVAAGTRLAVTDPGRALKDLWGAGATPPPELFPSEPPPA
ncbi:Linear gramicidin synthase subunit B [Nonomuraea coxensis DSM 45129]|uniref:Linear gramicidin synthase subunit B n=1 Tax=Nonomuraea coxensis DSM 45129 TaxID=1122611 RepID=A0ABX8U4N0_9ACTN|nr:condensation domain-containing protein [Nonomuraea coxensis]QYC42690.1 Linear gramicidin synthase subunit B [Nonomuraea coxensis DSM 45129]